MSLTKTIKFTVTNIKWNAPKAVLGKYPNAVSFTISLKALTESGVVKGDDTEEETDAKIGKFIQHKLIGDHSQAVVSFDWTVDDVSAALKTRHHGF